MSLNTTELGTLSPWYNSGHVVAFGFLDGAKAPIRTDWIVKIDRPNKRLYVKNGYYKIGEEIWDDNKANRLFRHLTADMAKPHNKSMADAIGRIAAARQRAGL